MRVIIHFLSKRVFNSDSCPRRRIPTAAPLIMMLALGCWMSVAAPTLELATDIDELLHYWVGSCADLVCTVSCAVFSLLEDVPS